jgi:hypothetical protein
MATTELELEISRMRDLAGGAHCAADDQKMLFAILQGTNPREHHALEFSGIAPAFLDDAKAIYRMSAKTRELGQFAQKRICAAVEKFLRTILTTEEVDVFKQKNPIDDGYDPNFINLDEALARVESSGIRDAGFGQGWNLQVAAKVLQTALGDMEISQKSCDQLWKHLARHWKDKCAGGPEDGHHANQVMSRAANRIQVAICYVANSHKYRIEEPIDFTEFEVVAFRD